MLMMTFAQINIFPLHRAEAGVALAAIKRGATWKKLLNK